MCVKDPQAREPRGLRVAINRHIAANALACAQALGTQMSSIDPDLLWKVVSTNDIGKKIAVLRTRDRTINGHVRGNYSDEETGTVLPEPLSWALTDDNTVRYYQRRIFGR